MSYDLNVYSSPGKFGLATVGEVEWGDACYSFDLTTVWRDEVTGSLYYADDSGCSCPSPYENTSRNDLILIDGPQAFIDHVNARIAALYDFNESQNERAKGKAAELIVKVREALR